MKYFGRPRYSHKAFMLFVSFWAFSLTLTTLILFIFLTFLSLGFFHGVKLWEDKIFPHLDKYI